MVEGVRVLPLPLVALRVVERIGEAIAKEEEQEVMIVLRVGEG